ncbi:putative csi2 protein [Erysiphe neolycopersici]|uniref:Putative csi2 protein n=1 Tax=Erysiphe neolycopersici TaxID=212602 RepID=A0A420HX80_9PEZI|nr:putative csi2 protein [Erysiphe neolycopersici]
MRIYNYCLLFSTACLLLTSRGTAARNDDSDLTTTTVSSTSTESDTALSTSSQQDITQKIIPTTTTDSTLTQKTAPSTKTSTPTPSASSTEDDALMDLPTLTGGYIIVPPSVPPTQNAPYMHQSNLPEGTVFIVVGATLGFLAVSVLAWRMGVAWCLHRSVRKAAFSQGMSDTKAIYRTIATPSVPIAPLYRYSDRDSSISLSGLGNKGGKSGNKSGASLPNSNTANLFFSPTAGASIQNGPKGSSSYLPAGYYTAGLSLHGNTTGQAPFGGPGISLSNLSIQSQGFRRSRSFDPSPPESPLAQAESNKNNQANTSILSLPQTNSGSDVGPSAYLEDLFDGENIAPRTHNFSDRQFSRGSNSTR